MTRPIPHLLASSPDPLAGGDFLSRAAAAGVDVSRPLASGGLVVDVSRYTVTFDGAELDLSPRQVELLALFLAEPGRVWSREHLQRLCWDGPSSSRGVDVQLCRLRRRTGLDLFRNIRERGWMLRPLV